MVIIYFLTNRKVHPMEVHNLIFNLNLKLIFAPKT